MGMLFRYHKKDIVEEKGAVKEAAPDVKKDEKNDLTADDIKGMSGAKLRKLAKEYGVESPEELTLGELRTVLVEKIG